MLKAINIITTTTTTTTASIKLQQKLMAEEQQQQQLPTLLLLRSPSPIDAILSRHFHLLKPYQSPLPLPLFLSAHSHRSPFRAALVSASTRVDADLLDSLPSLGVVATTSAGVNHIDLLECRRRNVRVAGAGTVFSADVADYAVGLVIDLLRKVSVGDRFVRTGGWPAQGEFPLGAKLGGKRVGIVGLGSIGSEIAKRLEAFGCAISYNSRSSKPDVAYPYFSHVRDLAAESDVLILCCALNEETRHLINSDVMDALGKDGIVINVGRGDLIDEKELVRYLMEGKIGGAGLDVFENEPAVPQELYSLENVVLTPHSAVHTPESINGLAQLMIANLEAFFSNKPLLSQVL